MCVCVCVCYMKSFLYGFIEAWNLLRHQDKCLFPYILPWLHSLVVISRTILVDTSGNDFLCHLTPNRNQWQTDIQLLCNKPTFSEKEKIFLVYLFIINSPYLLILVLFPVSQLLSSHKQFNISGQVSLFSSFFSYLFPCITI